jgi:hypothetical protein
MWIDLLSNFAKIGRKIDLSMTREADFESKTHSVQRFGWAILARNPVFGISIYDLTFFWEPGFITG